MRIINDIPEEVWALRTLGRESLAKHAGISDRMSGNYKAMIKDAIVYRPTHSLQKDGSVVGAFGCLHAPFDREYFLPFLKENFEARGVTEVVCTGDLTDSHAMSDYTTDPDGMSAGTELIRARERLEPYFEAFPNMKICIGNHDRRPYTLAFKAGMGKDCIRSLHYLWNAPDTVEIATEHWIDGVRYLHLDAKGKAYALAVGDGYSVVGSHWHHALYVQYRASKTHRVFGCEVGCGCDNTSYAMEYGKAAKNKPFLGCAVIRGGVEAEVIPMPLELDKYR